GGHLARRAREDVDLPAPIGGAERGGGDPGRPGVVTKPARDLRVREEDPLGLPLAQTRGKRRSRSRRSEREDKCDEDHRNRALQQIVLSRRRYDPATAAYIARRVREGKSEREAVRCLKRYLARHLFRLLER